VRWGPVLNDKKTKKEAVKIWMEKSLGWFP
jgi:hypothetical protein